MLSGISQNREVNTKVLISKLEALNTSINAIQDDIDIEVQQKAEAEAKLKAIDYDLTNLSPGDKQTIKEKVKHEIDEIVTMKVSDKVAIKKKTEECERQIIEREFIINELEGLMKKLKITLKKDLKEEIKNIKTKIENDKNDIISYRNTNYSLKEEAKNYSGRMYELNKEANELRSILGRFGQVKNLINNYLPPTPNEHSMRPDPQNAVRSSRKKMLAYDDREITKPVMPADAYHEDDAFWYDQNNEES